MHAAHRRRALADHQAAQVQCPIPFGGLHRTSTSAVPPLLTFAARSPRRWPRALALRAMSAPPGRAHRPPPPPLLLTTKAPPPPPLAMVSHRRTRRVAAGAQRRAQPTRTIMPQWQSRTAAKQGWVVGVRHRPSMELIYARGSSHASIPTNSFSSLSYIVTCLCLCQVCNCHRCAGRDASPARTARCSVGAVGAASRGAQ